jgi:hypothetical protein
VLDDFDNHTPVLTTTRIGVVIGNRLTLAPAADAQGLLRYLPVYYQLCK